MAGVVSGVTSMFSKIAKPVVSAATDLTAPILGQKTASFLADPLGLVPQETPAAPAAVAPAPAEPPKSAAAELAPAAPAAAAAVDPNKPEPEANTFAVRQNQSVQRAAAASATQSANAASLLGFVAPKKRSAARTILG